MVTIVARGNKSSPNLNPYLICIIVFAVITVMTIITIIFARFARRRQQRLDEETMKSAPQPMQSAKPRRKKTADLDRAEEEELQRQVMIRKSLASRASWRTVNDEDEVEVTERPNDLRRDWKEWEAGIQHKRSISTDTHPGIDPGLQLPSQLATPSISRSGSPARHPLLTPTSRSPIPSRLSSFSVERRSVIEGLDDLEGLRRNIQQQILRKNSEGNTVIH